MAKKNKNSANESELIDYCIKYGVSLDTARNELKNQTSIPVQKDDTEKE